MKVARALAVLLIAIEGVALALHSPVVVPAIPTAAAAGSLFLPWRVRISRRAGVWLALLGGLMLHFGLTLMRGVLPSDSPPLQFQPVQDTGCYLLAVQAAMLFVKRTDDRPPVEFPGMGILVMLCAGLQPMQTGREALFRIVITGFVLLATILTVSRRPQIRSARSAQMWWRRSLLIVLLVVLAFASWTTADAIDDWLDWFWAAVLPRHETYESGFSGGGDLAAISSLRLELSDQVQLRVQSVTRPGYMRGQAFSRFDGLQWESDSDYYDLHPLSKWPATLSDFRKSGHLFGRRSATAVNWQVFACEPVNPDGWVFAPLGTTHIITPAQTVELDEQDVFLTTEGELQDQSYIAVVPYDNSIAPLGDGQRRPLTWLPAEFRRELIQLASSVHEGCATTREKIAATERYFRTNYRYSLVHDWDADQEEPLLYFLYERPAAHCEFFATGAALLLRSAGVPCRYVTGYVVVEPGRQTGRWLARGWHAHAWVEAYDNERGWVVVEATPDSGVPGTSEYAKTGSAESGGSWIQWVTGIPWTVAVACGTVIAVGVGLIYVIRRTRRRRPARGPTAEFQRDPLYSAMHDLLNSMDRCMRNFQLNRGSSETLHDFAWRIRQRAAEEPRLLRAAQWYPIYAACRYDGDLDEETIGVLTARLHIAQSHLIESESRKSSGSGELGSVSGKVNLDGKP